MDTEQVKQSLIEIFSQYISNPNDENNRKVAKETYLKYFNGANTLFSENVSKAIWGSFDASEGKLSEKKAKEILENLRGQ